MVNTIVNYKQKQKSVLQCWKSERIKKSNDVYQINLDGNHTILLIHNKHNSSVEKIGKEKENKFPNRIRGNYLRKLPVKEKKLTS